MILNGWMELGLCSRQAAYFEVKTECLYPRTPQILPANHHLLDDGIFGDVLLLYANLQVGNETCFY